MKLRLPIVKPEWIEYLYRNPTIDPDSDESISFMKTCLINEISGWTVSTTGFTAAEKNLIVERIKNLGTSVSGSSCRISVFDVVIHGPSLHLNLHLHCSYADLTLSYRWSLHG